MQKNNYQLSEITFCGPQEENIPHQGSQDILEMQTLYATMHLLIFLLHTPTLPRYKKFLYCKQCYIS